MPTPLNAKRQAARRYRERMRAKGLRRVCLWLPDTRSPAFAGECRRQSILASRSRGNDAVELFLDAALDEVDGWNE